MLVVENSIFQPPDKLDVTFNEIDLQTFTNNKDRCWMTLVHYNKRSISQSVQDLQPSTTAMTFTRTFMALQIGVLAPGTLYLDPNRILEQDQCFFVQRLNICAETIHPNTNS